MNRIAAAMDQIKAWMNDHDAPLLVKNLAPGASAADLEEAERLLGMAIPTELQALWSVHMASSKSRTASSNTWICSAPRSRPRKPMG